MSRNWMTSVAFVALIASLGAAQAQSADVLALKAQTDALKRQNEQLSARLSNLEQQAAPVAAPAPGDFLAQVTKGPLSVVTDDGLQLEVTGAQGFAEEARQRW